ncbi:protein kinase domain-containing protein [Planctomycetes bacterium K23_9]|uniref:Serine/threonine-protein kinase PrkC n=1 Tax=Stieleria marina TaxID=1930275 RepID=A0A517NRF0_9BACT|nr:Serine/threonine-protein kinase PrkC [Planctomycetes bacterium K23_9]
MKVLIADDNPMWTKLLAKTVERYDFESVTVDNGRDALRELNDEDPPRIVFLDWQMPDIDGLSLCRKIKQSDKRPFTYVVILTSRDAEQDMIAGLEAGADDYLTKPVESVVIRSRLFAAKRIIEAIPPAEWSKPQVPGYEVHRVVGKGAFATVWEATQLETQRVVAMKLIRVDLATEQVFSRFAREIEVMKRMDHPNVAHVYDAEINSKLGYIAMDMVKGVTLQTHIRKNKPSPLELIKLAASVCDGLQHAHDHGVVHRDLKPSNIMVDNENQPKILDFGLCKSMFGATSPEDSAESVDGLLIGSPLFMAPEQAKGKNDEVNPRSDIYSLGVTIYMTLLRRHPVVVSTDDRSAAIKEAASGSVERPTKLNPNFSKTLEKILLKSLAHDPDDRYASAADFADDLRAFASNRENKAAEANTPL